MAIIFIDRIEITKGNAQYSSDRFAEGIDNIIKSFNMTLDWETHVTVRETKLLASVEITGKDEAEAIELMKCVFANITVVSQDVRHL